MEKINLVRHLIAALAVVTMTFAPTLTVSTADAQVRAGCGRNGCAAVGRNGAAAVGRRGGAAAVGRNGAVVRRPVNGGVVVRRPPGVVVVQPRYAYRPGGAVAAGAAIGFIAGATAVGIAGQPPHKGYCWYYTTPAKTSGFWDVCPK